MAGPQSNITKMIRWRSTPRIPNPVMCESLLMNFEIPDVGSGSGELGSVARGANLNPDLDPGDITKFWEVESNEPVQITDVQGRLSLRLAFWREVLHAPPPVLDCIENGYRLPLKFIPPSRYQPNHKSTMVHQSFVADAVEKLVKNRCTLKVSEMYVVPSQCFLTQWENFALCLI